MSLFRRVLTMLSALMLLTGIVVVSSGPAQAAALNEVYMINVHSGKSMAVSGARLNNNQPVVQWLSNQAKPDNDKIRMILTNAANEEYFLQAMHSSKCLVVQNASFALYARIIQHECTLNDTYANDIWKLERRWWGDHQYPQFRNKDTNLCIVVLGASMANGAELVQYTCNGSSNGLWSPSPAASS